MIGQGLASLSNFGRNLETHGFWEERWMGMLDGTRRTMTYQPWQIRDYLIYCTHKNLSCPTFISLRRILDLAKHFLCLYIFLYHIQYFFIFLQVIISNVSYLKERKRTVKPNIIWLHDYNIQSVKKTQRIMSSSTSSWQICLFCL